jgi:hypothetical protein
MKKHLVTILLLAITSLGTLQAQCNAKDLAKKNKNSLKPFNYDGFADNSFTFKDKPQTISVEFTAYAGQKYKLLFCSSDFKEEVKVNIYDKNKNNPKRQKLYDSSNGIDNLFWSFEPPRTGTFFIEYEIPAALDHSTTKTGCLVLIIGYK